MDCCHFFFTLAASSLSLSISPFPDAVAARSANCVLFSFRVRVERWHHRCVCPAAGDTMIGLIYFANIQRVRGNCWEPIRDRAPCYNIYSTGQIRPRSRIAFFSFHENLTSSFVYIKNRAASANSFVRAVIIYI